MLKLNLDKLQQLAGASHELAIERAFGETGMAALRLMHTALRNLYGHLEAEMIFGQLVLMVPLDSQVPHTGTIYREMVNLASDLLPHLRSGSALLTLGGDGNISWEPAIPIDLHILSLQAIVYQYHNERETIFANGVPKVLLNPSNLHVSIFAIPTFKELETALDDYKRRFVRTSGCMIFHKVWHTDDRLIFCNKPEKIMRNSLHQFLRITLRDAEVRPEFIVDTSHPVDIRVTWTFTTRLALIEIKWLGEALSENGTTSYRDARAYAGAQQLEEYLDANQQQVPNHTARGYLVVIDGRRRATDHTSTHVTRENGFYYENRDITYPIPRHTTRVDFAPPIRMFAEPICRPA